MNASTYLHEKRGWSLRQPRDENVIIMFTGGLDSSLLAELCISQLNVTVYPLYIRRGAGAQIYEENSARKVIVYLQKKYGNTMHDLYTINVDIPPSAFKHRYDINYVVNIGYPMRNALMELYAVQYAAMLSQNGTSIHSILVGAIAGDVRPDSQLDSFIAMTTAVCTSTDDWNWQILAPYLIADLLPGKKQLYKEDILSWGKTHHLPFDLTRSCTEASVDECGRCKACIRRRELIKNER